MRVVNTGNEFHVYSNAVQLYNGLPNKMYQIDFDPMKGYSLSELNSVEIHEKVYGVHQEKVAKVINSFKAFSRSLGVILSGDKGIGKSLFAKMLCQKANENGYPVVVCNGFTPGIAQFIDSMDQQMVVLFDEFDKTFSNKNNDEQAHMLSLFDGVSMNKKLFCVTCNSISGLNDFLINRPGRFHYHFRFEYPDKEQIQAYLEDNIPEEKHNEIDKVIDFSKKVQLNYDCLRAIAFEIIHSENFEEAIKDLNIIRSSYGSPCSIYLCFNDGYRMKEHEDLDLFSDNEEEWGFGSTSEVGRDYIDVEFTPADGVWSEEHGGYFIPVEKLNIKLYDRELSPEGYVMKAHGDFVNKHMPEHITGLVMRRNVFKNALHFY